MTQWYVKDLSHITGVSVQTLHHYDRIGLLKPSLRHTNGYRVYSEKDLLTLQQIIALKNTTRKEILDDFVCDIPTLKINLLDIATFNSLLKTRDAILSYVKMIIETKNLRGTINILDLCTGSADISMYIIDWARKNNKTIKRKWFIA